MEAGKTDLSTDDRLKAGCRIGDGRGVRTFTAENMALRERAAATPERRERALPPRLGAAALDALRRADGERIRRHVDREAFWRRVLGSGSPPIPEPVREPARRFFWVSALRRQHSEPRVLDVASRPSRAFRTRRPRRHRSTVRATPRPPAPSRAACPRAFVPPPPPIWPSRLGRPSRPVDPRSPRRRTDPARGR